MEGPLGIIGAMDVEVDLLVSQLENAMATHAADMTFHQGTVGGRPVVVVRSGIGKVNAAMCAQVLIDRFGVAAILNTGIAGSLDASIDIGDLVLSTDAVNHDYDASGLGLAPGQVSEMDVLAFPCDTDLLAVFEEAAHEVAPEAGVHWGRVASGDQFVNDGEVKRRIISTFGAICCEMEGAAIAQVCYRNKMPVAIVRVISDKADGSSEVDYPTFEAMAARTCASIVKRAIELL